MIDTLAFLWPAFLISAVLVGIHAYFGIRVLARKVVFVDLALAQIAALGTTVAFMLGHPAQSPATLGYSLAFTLLAAILLAFTRAWSTRVPQEALIGVIYVVAAAAAVLLVDQAPQGAEHLKQILTGNILTVGTHDLAAVVPLYVVVGLVHWLLRHRLAGDGSLLWELVFYATFGLVVTSSVAIAGVLLVFSFLIIPASIGMLLARSFAHQLVIGWLVGIVASAAGLVLSFALDLPTGATMVCAFGGALAVAGLLHPFLHGDRRAALRLTTAAVRWSIVAVLAASAILLAAAPRADQPLLDLLESKAPSVRSLYFSRVEATVYADAGRYAERHRASAEQLNERERRSRSEGEALDDVTVARLASLLKSYGEMRKGEQFVMSEVRGRARARARWAIGAVMLVLAAFIAPLPWRFWRRGARHRRAQ